ncbi:MAG: TetR/AcrR family transcriptional regulator [Phycisphaerae bacterium]
MISKKPEQAFEHGRNQTTREHGSDLRASYDDRVNRILEAATGLIARVGYANASMRSVAKAAQVSLAGLYHYFDSKEKMLFLIQFRTFNSLLSSLRERLHGVADPVEQLRVMVRTHVDYFAANMAALKVCSHELDSLTGDAYQETNKLRRDYYDIARGIINRVLDARAADASLDRHVATMSLFGMLNWLYRWYTPKPGWAPTTVANQISSQFLGGVLGVAGDQS